MATYLRKREGGTFDSISLDGITDEVYGKTFGDKNGMHYYEMRMWCAPSIFFKSKIEDPDFYQVVDFFRDGDDDPYDEEDFKELEEITIEELDENRELYEPEKSDEWPEYFEEE